MNKRYQRSLAIVPVSTIALLGASSESSAHPNFTLQSTIAYMSNQDGNFEVYLNSPTGDNPRRMTFNELGIGDGFAVLAPDGKKIVFDSNRTRLPGEAVNTSDLFLMEHDGSNQTHLTRGSTATWSPDGKSIAFHRSASGTGTPITANPGAATTDSDIFVANVDELVDGTGQPRNLTNSDGLIDDDADWSPDGEKIAYTRHSTDDNQNLTNGAEVYVLNTDGTGSPQRLTNNNESERGPDWSPDGTKLLFACRIGGGTADFEVCVMDANHESVPMPLTNDPRNDLHPTWSPDGQQIVFQRQVAPGDSEVFVMNADGSGQTQITNEPGTILGPNWGLLRVKVRSEKD